MKVGLSIAAAVLAIGIATPAAAHDNRHSRQHDRLEWRHDRSHDRLEDQHARAHWYGVSRREHRRVHRRLEGRHHRAHHRLEDRHDDQHDRRWRRGW